MQLAKQEKAGLLITTDVECILHYFAFISSGEQKLLNLKLKLKIKIKIKFKLTFGSVSAIVAYKRIAHKETYLNLGLSLLKFVDHT